MRHLKEMSTISGIFLVGVLLLCSTAAADETSFIIGDTDSNGIINITDVVYLLSYIFTAGPAPNPLPSGDVNCDQMVNISDAVYLMRYIFLAGMPPIEC